MIGDTVRVLIDTGAAEAREFIITATKNGRTVEVETKRGMIEISEVKSGGKVAKTDRFMSSRVIALIEERRDDDEQRLFEVES